MGLNITSTAASQNVHPSVLRGKKIVLLMVLIKTYCCILG